VSKGENRKNKRVRLLAHVMLLLEEVESPLVIRGVIADISLGGIGLHLFQPIEDGVKVKLEIRFSVGRGEIKTETTRGKTLYSYHIRDMYYVGIEFDQELNPLHHPFLCKRIQESLESF
jgi:hypothetical protein